jgi:RHS repeat-associated protein
MSGCRGGIGHIRLLPTALCCCFLAAALPRSASATSASPARPAERAFVATGLAAAHLPEPLVATGPTNAAEDEAVHAAVTRFELRRDPDDFSSLTGFLSAYPRSHWRVAVLANLGIDYLHYGYFSRALDAWQIAWQEGKDATGAQVRALVDRAVGELVQLDAKLGRKNQLTALLLEIGQRPVSGPGAALLQNGRDALWVMNHDPKHLYICGPLALKMLLLAEHASAKEVYFLNWVHADGPQGTSLAEIVALAKEAHADLEPVYRQAGERVPVPSIVHWKFGHFSAVVGERNGRYHLEDPTFGRQGLWVTKAALDAEASGYFLVPAGEAHAAAWRRVATVEAGRVWGAGYTTDDSGDPNCGMCGYAINEQKVSVHLTDTPVGYASRVGPSAEVMLAYAQRDQNQPANFKFFNVSQKWTVNWLSYVEDDPSSPGTNVTRYQRDGALYAYSGYDSSTHAFTPQEDDGSVLVLEKTSPATYDRFLKDGSIETYSGSDGSAVFPRNVFLNKITDPQGNVLTLDYGNVDGRIRLVSLTDATGRKTTFSYGSASSPLRITKITDPFGRSAVLTYDGNGRLSSITDVLGLTSKFAYDSSSEIDALTTPYGTTHFAFGGTGNRRFLNIIDPLGYGEREETFQPAPVPTSDPAAEVPQGMTNLTNEYLQYRDSFHWNKHQYALAHCTPNGGCNYEDARITHFTHDPTDIGLEWDTVESRKEPLENRVWYTYEGQPNGALIAGTYDLPTGVGRVLDSGQTQLTQTAYNAFGNPTGIVDPVGRTTTLAYAKNEIDVASIAQTTAAGPQTVARFTYNDQHRPLTYTDAAGGTTQYTYNSAGQQTSATNPLGQKTTYVYNATGDLTRIINADGKVAASFTYDSFDRVASYTDSEGWEVDYAYDAANRLTKAVYPDGTSEQYTYDKLDLASYKDRQGHIWRYVHDADRRLISVTDPLGHVTRYTYYEDGTLKSLTDPDGHTTTWDIDAESRQTAKIYADGTRETYQYGSATSRLAAVTDALGQTKTYQYTVDNRLAEITYLGALHLTPHVAFAYDLYLPRLVAMTDGTGTTTYAYVPVGRLGALKMAQESGPLPNGEIAYSYDALGRVASRTVGGASPETFAYDKIGRLVDHTDALGRFATNYLGETGQPTARRLVGGSVATAWSYLPNSGDRRLAGIANEHPGERQFKYATTPDDLITKITEERSGSLLQSWALGYDGDNRLTNADASVAGKYGYTLDPASNITSFRTPGGTSAAAYNKLNELAELGGKPLVYDADGDLVSDGVRAYSWDAENRLVAVTQAGTHTTFAYDGLDRRVLIATTKSGKTTTTDYLWCGTQICESRNGAHTVARLYYREGEVIPAAKAADDSLFYYGPDQLGSVRDVYAKSPVFSMVQEYDYDPYGNPTRTPATGPFSDFRYAGMLYNSDSGLYLTQYRAYDPRIGRWLTRDPMGEQVGPNLFAYVSLNPLSLADRSGLQGGAWQSYTGGGGFGGSNITPGGGGFGGSNITPGGGGFGGSNITPGGGGFGGSNITPGGGGFGGSNITPGGGGFGRQLPLPGQPQAPVYVPGVPSVQICPEPVEYYGPLGGPNGEMYGIPNGDGTVTPDPAGGYYPGFGPNAGTSDGGAGPSPTMPGDPAPEGGDSGF